MPNGGSRAEAHALQDAATAAPFNQKRGIALRLCLMHNVPFFNDAGTLTRTGGKALKLHLHRCCSASSWANREKASVCGVNNTKRFLREQKYRCECENIIYPGTSKDLVNTFYGLNCKNEKNLAFHHSMGCNGWCYRKTQVHSRNVKVSRFWIGAAL